MVVAVGDTVTEFPVCELGVQVNRLGLEELELTVSVVLLPSQTAAGLAVAVSVPATTFVTVPEKGKVQPLLSDTVQV